MIKVKTKLNVDLKARGRKVISSVTEVDLGDDRPVRPKLHRVTKLMALAIRFQEMLRTGEAHDLTDLARMGKVSQPRMSQIMGLNLLAPDIQRELLDLPPQGRGKPFLHEKRIRPITAILDWAEQRRAWAEMLTQQAEFESATEAS
ncbi:hypothetical protein Pla22_38530 [Rubripirellula amarantea]|uniref:Uncharacterized protein n=1 Tax=Rubripirellula amarantea TaxID=2527999 RepID=A0A5C5WKE8_9BACT|nr:hypothetical protein Pla22_38530 [Rubripirellula amarantea]